MTPSVRLAALLTLIGLSVWLGFLLGKGSPTSPPPPVPAPTISDTEETAKQHIERRPATPGADSNARINALTQRIEQLADQTDDRIINSERAALLNDLAIELRGPDGPAFAASISYYNKLMPRDGTGLLLESHYHNLQKRWQAAVEPLITAAEFPESNEQLEQIRAEQTRLIDKIYQDYAKRDDWLGLSDYFEALLLRDPNNDRIRLQLADAQAQAGDLTAAIETLNGTGTEGVTQIEIDTRRDTLLRTDIEPIRFRDEGGALVARATLNSADIELLVDTGATKTALATNTLRRLGAYPTNESAQVQTASGRITAQLYRVPELFVENARFRNLTVLALDNPPDRWDGLLGMDLLREMNVDLSGQISNP